ncbi:hypothetical protein K493DRAFT_343070 [Basidiobolus meristosporus CBS 931.73]|uniref:Uncharacterized protein n=1 Tax=Basidiobolus meristosporus CBS 931.73 TaxID=1314790 RepID=A0A1Y1WQI0_9FUNG|nr:hypothetical protein K493DRAFT_343070 [Basidiobolus meristosporus CBS 931.73]|eukprot:ORX75787.1 hypothetical protein K493DRAFT_343070 [Basidiobolus meristosporus CBS 931.73]
MSGLSIVSDEEYPQASVNLSLFESSDEDSAYLKTTNLSFSIFSEEFRQYHQSLVAQEESPLPLSLDFRPSKSELTDFTKDSEQEYKRAKHRNQEQAGEIEELRRRTKLSQIQIEAAKQEFKQTQSRNSELLSYLNQVKAGLLPVLLRIEQKLGETGEGPPDSQCSPEEFVRYTRELSAKVAKRKMKSEPQ